MDFLMFIISALIFLIVYFNTLKHIRRYKSIKNFESYIALLEYYMQKAYDIIYKERILIYSLEAVKINDIEFQVTSKDFALLVLKMMGDNLKEEYTFVYGNEETLIFTIIEYFNSRFETDEIRKKATDNIMSNDDETSNIASFLGA